MAVGDRLAKNLWFRVGEEASDSDVVEICYKSYHQYEQAEYFFSKQDSEHDRKPCVFVCFLFLK